jgi:hypothetical protein
MKKDLISRAELLADVASFTAEQREARELFSKLGLVLPRDWLRVDSYLSDASADGRVATGIYNTVVESGGASDPRFRHLRDPNLIAGSFADIIKWGGDALLWALIRIGVEESSDEDLAELAESRGFIVRLPRREGV